MSRLPLLPADDALAAGERARVPEALGRLNVFRLLLHDERLAKAVADLLLTLLGGRHLPHRLRELVIMRLGWATGSAYEWTQHWPIAQAFGVAADELLAVRDWREGDTFGPAERAVLAAVDDVLATGAIGAQAWEQCRQHVGDDAALLELVAAIGAWQMVSVLLRSVQVPLEDGIDEWPPDGRKPE